MNQSSYNGETLRMLVPNEDNHNRAASIVQGYLLQLGINCTIDSFDNAMFQSAFTDPAAFDISICQMGMNDVAFVWSAGAYNLNKSFGFAVIDEQYDEMLNILNHGEGHNNDQATIVSDYINEMAYAENLMTTNFYWIVNKDLGITDIPMLRVQERYIACSTFQ